MTRDALRQALTEMLTRVEVALDNMHRNGDSYRVWERDAEALREAIALLSAPPRPLEPTLAAELHKHLSYGEPEWIKASHGWSKGYAEGYGVAKDNAVAFIGRAVLTSVPPAEATPYDPAESPSAKTCVHGVPIDWNCTSCKVAAAPAEAAAARETEK